MQGEYAVFIRNKDGELYNRINDYVKLHMLMTLNDVGSWNISSVSKEKCPFAEGDGIIVVRNATFLYGGVMTQISDDYDAHTMIHKWQVQGKGDLEYMNRRYCHTDPQYGRTNAYRYYTDNGKLGKVVGDLIQKNLGVNALTERKEAIIKDYAMNDIGPNITVSLRFQNLLKTVISLVSGNGYNIRPNWDDTENKIYYDIYQGRDLTDNIVFSDQFSNILSAEHLVNIPQGNYILAGGTGEGISRSFASAQDSDSISKWGLIECFQDGRNQNTVSTYASETLADKTSDVMGYSCTASSNDLTPQYGVDYVLGDFIGMHVFGQFVTAEVQQVEINVEGGIETVEPRFGTVAIGKLRNIFRQLADLRSDVDELLGTEVE